MKPDEARQQAVSYLLGNADEALESAAAELTAGRLRYAMNRIYYACFYATSAVLLAEKRSYGKHSGVRSALHQHLIKPGRVPAELGQFYADIFADRQEGDYGILVQFDVDIVGQRLETARRFVEHMKGLRT
jgi:uncharacterized protein